MVAALAAAARNNLMASLRQQQATPPVGTTAAAPNGLPPAALQQPSPGLGPVKAGGLAGFGPAASVLSPSTGAAGGDVLQQLQQLSMQSPSGMSDLQQLEALAGLECVEPTAADLGPLMEFKDPAKPAPSANLPLTDVSRILQQSYIQGKGVPLTGDAELPTGSTARRRSPLFPASYPTTRHPTLESNQFLKKMEEQTALETAFYSFYQQPGTLQQYIAAQYLRSKSWRYHRMVRAWFLRQSEPLVVTDTYERGNYMYFDFNFPKAPGGEGWTYRFKQDMTIEFGAISGIEEE